MAKYMFENLTIGNQTSPYMKRLIDGIFDQ